MKSGAMLWLIGAVLALGVFVYWLNSDPAGADRYKMTVEIDTPEGVRSGFAVREAKIIGGSSWFPFGENRGVHYRLKGEAVAVDLPSGETVFALLTGARGEADYAGNILKGALGPEETRWDNPEPVELWPNAPPNPSFKHSSSTPMLVTFGDMDDPTSVAKVDPDDFAASFGEGYTLKRITVQITDEPVTTGIEKRLGWLGNLGRYRTDPGNPFTNTLPKEIGGLRSK